MSFLASLTIINTSTNVGIYGGGKAMKKSLLLALTMLFIGMFSVTGVADEPETPSTPDEPSTPTPKKTDHPKTGDTTNIILPTALLAAAITSLIYVMARRKKH